MKLLLDANLSPRLVPVLVSAGYEAAHVDSEGLLGASDAAIFDYAGECGLVVVTADSDFPMLLALRRASNPSVIHLRNADALARTHLDAVVWSGHLAHGDAAHLFPMAPLDDDLHRWRAPAVGHRARRGDEPAERAARRPRSRRCRSERGAGRWGRGRRRWGRDGAAGVAAVVS